MKDGTLEFRFGERAWPCVACRYARLVPERNRVRFLSGCLLFSRREYCLETVDDYRQVETRGEVPMLRGGIERLLGCKHAGPYEVARLHTFAGQDMPARFGWHEPDPGEDEVPEGPTGLNCVPTRYGVIERVEGNRLVVRRWCMVR